MRCASATVSVPAPARAALSARPAEHRALSCGSSRADRWTEGWVEQVGASTKCLDTGRGDRGRFAR